LTEIVVTAQKREERLQTTPVTASVLGQGDLDAKQVDSLQDLQQVVPSLSVGETGSTSSINIRGIGLNISSPAVVMGVAVYRDGLFQPPLIANEPLFDMAGVEVLRGPQGTFVGSNSTGGAIFYRTQDPQFTGLNGNVEVGYGNYDDISVQAAVNLPISDDLAARVAVNYENRDSFFTNAGDVPNLHGTGEAFSRPGRINQGNVRVGFKWAPNANLTVLAKVALSRNDTGGLAHVMSPANPYYDGRPLKYELTYNVPYTQFIEKGNRDSLQIDYEFDNGITIRSISGYTDIRLDYIEDMDSSSSPGGGGLPPADRVAALQVHEYMASQEFNILSPAGERFDWVVGAFYFYNWARVAITIDQPPPAPGVLLDAPGVKESLAGFAQVGYYIVPDQLQLQVGGRYTSNHAHNTGTLTLTGLAPFPIVQDQTAKQSDADWTGKVSLNWTISPSHYAYAFASKGYKAGGINGPGTPTFKPETVYDYEVGLKSTLFDGHVRTQINGFYMDYSNLQLSSYIVPEPGSAFLGGSGVTNAAGSTIWGFEAQAQARFGGLGLDASLSHVESELGRTAYVNPNLLPGGGLVPLGPQCTAGVSPPACFDYGPYTADLTGRPNPYSPEWTVNGGIEYSFDLAGGELTPRFDVTYIGDQWQTIQGLAADLIPAHTLMNVSLTYTSGDWRAQGYVTNLTDEIYIVGQTQGPSYYLGRPRQFGVRVSRSF